MLRPSSARPTARAIRRTLQRLARLWDAPTLRTLAVEEQRSLRTTLGRYRPRAHTVEFSPRAWASPDWPEILTHEAAHAAAGATPMANGQAPHGREWRRLMALAGYPEARGTRWRGCLERPAATSGPRRPTRARYLHACTVCDFHRTARRPMRAWRCAACVAAGLGKTWLSVFHSDRPEFRRILFVAKPAALAELEDPHLFAWGRNGESDLVGFKIDRRGRMVGEASVPTAGLDDGEWRIYVKAGHGAR